MWNVLVTGSSRGLGLELVKQIATKSEFNAGLVLATARSCSSDLQEVILQAKGSVVFVALDVIDEEIIAHSAKAVEIALRGRSLDILINCAGVHGETHGKLALMSGLEYQFSANVLGVHNVTRHYISLMKTSSTKKVISISSIFGSLTNAREVAYAPCPAYKISKAALNALMVQYALSYEEEGYIFLVVSPGWLKSDMGGQDADLTVSQGAEAVLNVVMSASDKDNGRFKNIFVPGWKKYDGGDLKW
ncbi:hydroxyacyl dehydrogenase [Penicillium angulare]|uniref:Hydroxyacyl dehydrogenase n=1 Tax=Penicillium angulare TaxID=116970 RepID=A0A9W9EST6_9EURO|nr:hydroxyacyl dehydrogenase [Penicillium angulare]